MTDSNKNLLKAALNFALVLGCVALLAVVARNTVEHIPLPKTTPPINVRDTGLTPRELTSLAVKLTGHPVRPLPAKELTGGGVNLDPDTGLPTEIQISDALAPDEIPTAIEWAVGYTIDILAGGDPVQGSVDRPGIPIDGIEKELDRIYTLTATGEDRTFNPVHPQDFGYKGVEVDRQFMTEAIRAYLTKPTYFKSVAPMTAQRIRDYANKNPRLKPFIQFN